MLSETDKYKLSLYVNNENNLSLAETTVNVISSDA